MAGLQVACCLQRSLQAANKALLACSLLSYHYVLLNITHWTLNSLTRMISILNTILNTFPGLDLQSCQTYKTLSVSWRVKAEDREQRTKTWRTYRKYFLFKNKKWGTGMESKISADNKRCRRQTKDQWGRAGEQQRQEGIWKFRRVRKRCPHVEALHCL